MHFRVRDFDRDGEVLCSVLFAATAKASCGAHASAFEDGHATVLEEPSPSSDRKKERLSRQERTALVESFVIKCVKITSVLNNRITIVLA